MALKQAYELHMKNIYNCRSFWKVWIFGQFREKVLLRDLGTFFLFFHHLFLVTEHSCKVILDKWFGIAGSFYI